MILQYATRKTGMQIGGGEKIKFGTEVLSDGNPVLPRCSAEFEEHSLILLTKKLDQKPIAGLAFLFPVDIVTRETSSIFADQKG